MINAVDLLGEAYLFKMIIKLAKIREQSKMQQPFYTRIDVWKDTEKNAPNLIGHKSTKYKWDLDYVIQKRFGSTSVCVMDRDLIDQGKDLIEQRPLIVNPADDCFPGGFVDLG